MRIALQVLTLRAQSFTMHRLKKMRPQQMGLYALVQLEAVVPVGVVVVAESYAITIQIGQVMACPLLATTHVEPLP